MKTERRVLVVMINPDRHIECMEVTTLVRMVGGLGTEGFEADLPEIEKNARRLLATYEETEPEFELIGIMCALLEGYNAGRILWVKQAPTKQITIW